MKDEVGGRRGLNHKVTKSTEGWGRWGNFSHEIHGNNERGEAPESAASAVVFLSAYVWSWVVLGNPRIRGMERISRKDPKTQREEEEEFLTTENAKSTEGKRSGIDHEIHGKHERGRAAH